MKGIGLRRLGARTLHVDLSPIGLRPLFALPTDPLAQFVTTFISIDVANEEPKYIVHIGVVHLDRNKASQTLFSSQTVT